MYHPALAQVSPPAEQRIAIRISPSAERAIRGGHPWLFDQAITYQSREGHPGDFAVLFNDKRKFLGIGFYDPHSPIRVRVLQHRKQAPINTHWFQERIIHALKIREPLYENNTGYRLIHGGNDGLPGLVVDRYDSTLVLKLDTAAWIPHLTQFLPILENILHPERMILRLARGVARHPEVLYGLEDGTIIYGDDPDVSIRFLENGITFEVDPIRGQKTGFFLDQRHNRARVESLSCGKSVLNVFSYTGGFSLFAARGGAKKVASLDISQPALDAAQRNFGYNLHNVKIAACKHQRITGDAFQVLKNLAERKKLFDLVIIDPPSFAKQQNEIHGALSAYRRLTHLGLGVLAPGGTLVQASCSSRIKADVFFDTLHQTASNAGRPLVEIERTGHAIDHPIGFPEGEYLKCLFAKG